MNDTNTVVLVGRVVRDVGATSVRALPTGTTVLNFSIACNKSMKKGDEWREKSNFFDIVFYGKHAGSVQPYLIKGKQIAVCGHLEQQRWEKDNQAKSKVVVIADMIQLLGGGKGGDKSESVAAQPPDYDLDTIPF
ncbi:MAG: single-stranded DNA-binding protein [Treponema sp.]